MRVALKLAYDGRKFHGFARQPQLKTVEGEIIKSLVSHGIIEDTKESVLRYASRTDKGVSALSNVIAFNTKISIKNIIKDLSQDSSDFLIYGFEETDNNFNPRFAKMRVYRYYLLEGNLDIEKIKSASKVFIGKHDFTNFCRLESYKDPIRSIKDITLKKKKEFLLFDFYGHTFLWNQIRRIISSLIKIGQNKIERQELVEALSNPEKIIDYGLAPAENLILKEIVYDFDFKTIEKMKKQLIKFEKNFELSLDISFSEKKKSNNKKSNNPDK